MQHVAGLVDLHRLIIHRPERRKISSRDLERTSLSDALTVAVLMTLLPHQMQLEQQQDLQLPAEMQNTYMFWVDIPNARRFSGHIASLPSASTLSTTHLEALEQPFAG